MTRCTANSTGVRNLSTKIRLTEGYVLSDLILAEDDKYNDDVRTYEVPDNERRGEATAVYEETLRKK